MAAVVLSLTIMLSGCTTEKTKKATLVQEAAVDTIPTLVMQIRKCSRLYTSEYDVHKIITHADVPRLKGRMLGHDIDLRLPVGDRKIAIPIDVKLKAYIDFREFSERNVEHRGGKIVITLPDPKVALTSSKVDQAGIKEYVSITRSRFTDEEMTELERQGRDAVVKTIPDLGIVETARDNAARIIIPMIMNMGYDEKDITVTFRKDFSRNDLMNIITRNKD